MGNAWTTATNKLKRPTVCKSPRDRFTDFPATILVFIPWSIVGGGMDFSNHGADAQTFVRVLGTNTYAGAGFDIEGAPWAAFVILTKLGVGTMVTINVSNPALGNPILSGAANSWNGERPFTSSTGDLTATGYGLVGSFSYFVGPP